MTPMAMVKVFTNDVENVSGAGRANLSTMILGLSIDTDFTNQF